MNKRASIVYKTLTGIIAAGFIIYVFVNAGISFGSQEAFYKLAIARDLALMMDLMYGLPGDLQFTYPNDVSNYDIEIKNNVVKIYNPLSIADPTARAHSFAGIGSDSPSAEIKAKKFVRLQKVDNKITITGISDEEK